MNCVYCGGDTQVINSRLQSRNNKVWRRRRCKACGALFTSHESLYLPAAFSVKKGEDLEPFDPDRLSADILRCLQGQQRPYETAKELTSTISQKIIKNASRPLISPQEIGWEAAAVLKRFNKQAWLRYVAEHPSLHTPD